MAAPVAPGVVNGKPRRFKAGMDDGVWIWREASGLWSVRTTTRGKLHVFSGHVLGRGAPIGWYRKKLVEFGDTIAKGPSTITFRLETAGHIDGFDFRPANNGCVRFHVSIDEHPIPGRIFLGATAINPPSNHFVACP